MLNLIQLFINCWNYGLFSCTFVNLCCPGPNCKTKELKCKNPKRLEQIRQLEGKCARRRNKVVWHDIATRHFSRAKRRRWNPFPTTFGVLHDISTELDAEDGEPASKPVPHDIFSERFPVARHPQHRLMNSINMRWIYEAKTFVLTLFFFTFLVCVLSLGLD